MGVRAAPEGLFAQVGQQPEWAFDTIVVLTYFVKKKERKAKMSL